MLKCILDKSFLSSKEQGEALKQLRTVSGYIQNHCKQSEGWFKAPRFMFAFDEHLEQVSRIEALFKQISTTKVSDTEETEEVQKDSSDES